MKNRRANGEQHYWVRANVTPIRSGEAVVGYLSVRTRPGEAEIAAAEALYRAFREGRAQRKYAFHKGLIVRKGVAGSWGRLGQALPIKWSLRLPLSAVGLATIATVALAGLPWQAALPPVLVTLAAGLWLEARVLRPMMRLRQQTAAVAAGHVDAHAHIDRVDELGMAARAGAAGWGFAVVAGEVRSLAQRSAEAPQAPARADSRLADADRAVAGIAVASPQHH